VTCGQGNKPSRSTKRRQAKRLSAFKNDSGSCHVPERRCLVGRVINLRGPQNAGKPSDYQLFKNDSGSCHVPERR
jgi:hypothetical protein